MNAADAICREDMEPGEYVPDYRCEDCGVEVSTLGRCDACQEKFDEFLINGNDPRR